jgi:hypothetical protein
MKQKMKQKKNATYYLRRAVHYLRRAVEIGLFTHTPCPSRTVTELLVQENKDQILRDRVTGKHAGTRQQLADRMSFLKAKSGHRQRPR